ncbi:hypothetical protein [Sodalis sp. dw_96]|uniref:hypothetical protein n=1 Tax=Sodalis sp. dw_96 TaxID=2719794 RepID=UPI001BD4A45B|nr:hypothetical protein [Sodalis sp. dw_96]
MPPFWGNKISRYLPLVNASVDSNNNSKYLSNIKKVSNCCNEYYEYSPEKKGKKRGVALPITMVPIAGRLSPQSFKQLFVEHCLGDFFTLYRGNKRYAQEKFLDEKGVWTQNTIKLYACSNYIVSHYMEICAIQQEANAKKFHKHMKKLSNLVIGGDFYKVSKCSYVIDETHEDYPRVRKLLEKIGGEIVEIFDNSNGPSDQVIGLLLNNHSVQIVKNSYGNIVVNHTLDAQIKNARKIINERNHRIRQRNSSSMSYTGEHLIRLIGIRTQNQCLKIGENGGSGFN